MHTPQKGFQAGLEQYLLVDTINHINYHQAYNGEIHLEIYKKFKNLILWVSNFEFKKSHWQVFLYPDNDFWVLILNDPAVTLELFS